MAQSAGEVKVIFAADTSSWSAALDKAQAQLNKLKGAAAGASTATRREMEAARGSVMVLGEEIGVHLPRHVQKFVAELPGVATAMSAAFSAVAVFAIGAAIFEAAKKLSEFADKGREAAEKLKKSQEDYGDTIESVFRSYGQKMLTAGAQADELAGNHLAALQKQLELINEQGFDDLLSAFDKISAKSQEVFKNLQAGWLDTVASMLSGGVSGSGVPGVMGSEQEFQRGLRSFRDKNDFVGAAGYAQQRLGRESNILGLENALLNNPSGPQATGIAGILSSEFSVDSVTPKSRDAQQQFVSEIDDTIRAIRAQVGLTGSERGNAITKEQIQAAQELRKELDANLKLMGDTARAMTAPLANLRPSGLLAQQKADAQMLGSPLLYMTSRDTDWITNGAPKDLAGTMGLLAPPPPPNVTLGAMGQLSNTVRDLASQFTNLGAVLSQTVTRSLNEFNDVLAGMISGKKGASFAKMGQEVTDTVTRSGLQYAEGSLMKGLFGTNTAKGGTRANPWYVRLADDAGTAGKTAGGLVGGALKGLLGRGGSTSAPASSSGGGFAGILSTILPAILPGFASGGPISANMPSIVGENGPEIFTPSSSGRIIPNDRAFGGGDTHVNVDARGSGDPAAVEATVHRAMRGYMRMVPAMALSSVKDHNSRSPRSARLG